MLRALVLALGLLLAGSEFVPAPSQAAQANRWLATIAKTPEGGYRQGNPNAPIKLVEYGSRSCPTCGQFAREGMAPLRNHYVATGKVSYEFRDFPVHPQDVANIMLGRCVPVGAYFRLLDAMFEQQAAFAARGDQITIGELQRIRAIPPEQAAAAWANAYGYTEFMRRQGLSAARIQQCLADRAGLEAFAGEVAAAQTAGVRGTPTFFINGRMLDHAHNWAELEAHLKASGA